MLTDMVPEMDTIVYVPVPLYYYMIRESSLSQKSDLSDLLKLYELVEGRYQKYSALYEGLSVVSIILVISKRSGSTDSLISVA